ncbi:histidine phosphatase family protein [Anaerobacillus alkaliphilus]|nr:histidine phosphatase family protein [Anaerobacillus alkaliphilus]
MDDIVSITLFRHGITKENLEKRYIGWTDVSIDMNSLNEVRIPTLERSFQKVFSSDLKRCVETACLLVPGSTIIKDSRLRELHFGEWERKTYNDLKDQKEYQQWLRAPFLLTTPKGEAYTQLETRVLEFWKELITVFENEETKNVLLITHGGPIRFLLTYFSPKESKKDWWEWSIEHFCGYTLSWNRKNLLKGGSSCTSSLVEPFMVKRTGL